jgi:hypothetical protein
MSAEREGGPAIFRCCLLAAALVLAASCHAQGVTGFAWKDAQGASQAFTQKSNWPAGEEGRFAAGRQSNLYSLGASLVATPSSSLLVEIKRGASEPGARVRLSLSPKADGSSPSQAASFPLLTERARLLLPLEAGSRLASLKVAAEGGTAVFAVESVALVPAFRGYESGPEGVTVSAGFSRVLGQGYQELSIERPFAGIAPARTARRSVLPGILLDYGPSPPGSSLILAAQSQGGSARTFTLLTHAGGARTCLDPSLLGDASSLVLRAPEGIAIRAFYAAELGIRDYELADLGRVLLSDAPVEGYALYRWDLLPSVLVFDFRDYATQDRYLKRLAFFVEKLGFRGRLAKDEEIAALHGWNAHDYRPEDLADFFRTAREKAFPLGAAEKELEGILLGAGVITESGGVIGPGAGAMISIARESSEALRRTFAVHESTHAVFFADVDYRRFARSLWASLDAREKWFWKAYLGWAGYDVGSDYLMGNEFQAYLLQQPASAAEEYFAKRKGPELLEKHPELKEKVDAYMAEFGGSFARRAKRLEAWLYAKYGIEAGRTIFLARR